MKDYFKILGVVQGAPDEEIKKAYRSLAMKHHPDRGGDQAMFQEIQEAYAVLSNPQKRSEWEMQRNGGGAFGGGNAGGFHFNFGGGGDPFDIHDLFRNFHQGGGDPFGGFQQRQQQRRNRDLSVAIDLDLASTLEKQTKHISVTHVNGTRKTVTIDIPRGVNGNMQMKYAGHGDQSYGDLPAGDLYIHFRVLQDPNFEVEGIDLIKVIRLNCLDAITGTSLNVDTLDGKQLTWNIPVGTQNGSRFRLGQYGLWNIDHPVRGSLIVHIHLIVPTDLTTEQLIAIEKISQQLKENTGTNV
jgi:DnaJ-class molecular chaperone